MSWAQRLTLTPDPTGPPLVVLVKQRMHRYISLLFVVPWLWLEPPVQGPDRAFYCDSNVCVPYSLVDPQLVPTKDPICLKKMKNFP